MRKQENILPELGEHSTTPSSSDLSISGFVNSLVEFNIKRIRHHLCLLFFIITGVRLGTQRFASDMSVHQRSSIYFGLIFPFSFCWFGDSALL